ncbi:MAG TPA: hypothetical protein VMH88_02040 [Gemmatimonadales bacterium]|nr:hypothetical protein [Gemmatimonadales bacterium]
MTSSAPATTDRSNFSSVLANGTKVGLCVGVLVVAFLAVSRMMPAGTGLAAVQTLIVLAGGVAASLLPGEWAVARETEGVAGAAAIGLWGTVVFSAFDIVLLRPFKAFPWTWDAIGGNSTWWYLPIWWMLGTYLAWMGGMLVAGRNARQRTSFVQIAAPVVIGALVVGILARVLGCPEGLPVTSGAGLVLTLTVLALISLVRQEA